MPLAIAWKLAAEIIINTLLIFHHMSKHHSLSMADSASAGRPALEQSSTFFQVIFQSSFILPACKMHFTNWIYRQYSTQREICGAIITH